MYQKSQNIINYIFYFIEFMDDNAILSLKVIFFQPKCIIKCSKNHNIITKIYIIKRYVL